MHPGSKEAALLPVHKRTNIHTSAWDVKTIPMLAEAGDVSESLGTPLPGLRAVTTAFTVTGNTCRAHLWTLGAMLLFDLIAIPL